MTLDDEVVLELPEELDDDELDFDPDEVELDDELELEVEDELDELD